MLVVLHGLPVIPQIEVRVPELAVNGAERPQIVGAGLDRSLKKCDSCPAVARFAQSLALEGEFEAHVAGTIVGLQEVVLRNRSGGTKSRDPPEFPPSGFPRWR